MNLATVNNVKRRAHSVRGHDRSARRTSPNTGPRGFFLIIHIGRARCFECLNSLIRDSQSLMPAWMDVICLVCTDRDARGARAT